MDTIPMPVFYKDAQGAYQGCNRAFEEFVGKAKERVIGKTVYDIAKRDLAEAYHRKDRELLDNPGIQVYEHPVKHADGSLRHVIFSKATYSDTKGNVDRPAGRDARYNRTEKGRGGAAGKRNQISRAGGTAAAARSMKPICRAP